MSKKFENKKLATSTQRRLKHGSNAGLKLKKRDTNKTNKRHLTCRVKLPFCVRGSECFRQHFLCGQIPTNLDYQFGDKKIYDCRVYDYAPLFVSLFALNACEICRKFEQKKANLNTEWSKKLI